MFVTMLRKRLTYSSVTVIEKATSRRFASVGSREKCQKKDFLGIVFFSSICIVATGLGTWQVQRYMWKVDLINTIKSCAAGPAATIEQCTAQIDFAEKARGMKGKVVRMRGSFHHDRELFLGLRSAPQTATGGPAQGMASNPQGYYVITPFTREDGCVVYINRGWIPRSLYTQLHSGPAASSGKAQPATTSKPVTKLMAQPWERPQGVVEVEVAISAPEKAGTFSPQNAPNSHILLWLEPAALLRHSASSSDTTTKQKSVDSLVVAEAVVDSADTPQIFPCAKSVHQLQEQSVAPETHFVYAFTWFTLAAAGFYMTYIKFRRGGGGVGGGIRSAGSIAKKTTPHKSKSSGEM